MTSQKINALMFRCPKTGGDFDSGFTVSQKELAAISGFARLRARCPQCRESHELKFVDGWIRVRTATTPGARDLDHTAAYAK